MNAITNSTPLVNITKNRNPFHNDKNPSMKVDKHFHCFACQADGDAVDFVPRLFGLPSKAAAMKLADDFGISYDNRQKHRIKNQSRCIHSVSLLQKPQTDRLTLALNFFV